MCYYSRVKVYFSTSGSNLNTNIEACRIILGIIKNSGHDITRNWIEESYSLSNNGYKYSSSELSHIYNENLRALRESDVVILESTYNTFNNGYLAGQSINLQKPLLILTKHPKRFNSFLMGENTTLKYFETYKNNEHLKSIVSNFLEHHDDNINNIRFNMFIGKNISNFLKTEAKIKGKTKAKVVREILESHIYSRNK